MQKKKYQKEKIKAAPARRQAQVLFPAKGQKLASLKQSALFNAVNKTCA